MRQQGGSSSAKSKRHLDEAVESRQKQGEKRPWPRLRSMIMDNVQVKAEKAPGSDVDKKIDRRSEKGSANGKGKRKEAKKRISISGPTTFRQGRDVQSEPFGEGKRDNKKRKVNDVDSEKVTGRTSATSLEIMDSPPPKGFTSARGQGREAQDEGEVEMLVGEAKPGPGPSSQERRTGNVAASGSKRKTKVVWSAENIDVDAVERLGGEGDLVNPNQAFTILPSILEIVPVDPEYLFKMIQNEVVPTLPTEKSISKEHLKARIIIMLLERDKPYPKQKPLTKGKLPYGYLALIGDTHEPYAEGDDDEANDSDAGAGTYADKNWLLEYRAGTEYIRRSIQDLQSTFSLVPLTYIRSCLALYNNTFAPTFLKLQCDQARPVKDRPYQELQKVRTLRVSKVKRKQTKIEDATGNDQIEAADHGVFAYETEKVWLNEFLYKRVDTHSVDLAAKLVLLDGEGEEECQCCFGKGHALAMISCENEEKHLFCRPCLVHWVSTIIGEQKAHATCMDSSGCEAGFSELALRKLLDPKTLQAYETLVRSKDLQSAAIEGFETCPYCDYGVCNDNPEDKLFQCQAPECGIVSCRKCRAPNHLPESCQAAAASRRLDRRHAVEEAMTEALLRRCPNPACKKAFVKESGCNKIRCTQCGTLSCYICRKIVDGYDHFDQDPTNYRKPVKRKNCRLWNPSHGVDQYIADMAEARRIAQEQVRANAELEGVAIADDDLDVALPAPRANPHAHMEYLDYVRRLQEPRLLQGLGPVNDRLLQPGANRRAVIPGAYPNVGFGGGVVPPGNPPIRQRAAAFLANIPQHEREDYVRQDIARRAGAGGDAGLGAGDGAFVGAVARDDAARVPAVAGAGAGAGVAGANEGSVGRRQEAEREAQMRARLGPHRAYLDWLRDQGLAQDQFLQGARAQMRLDQEAREARLREVWRNFGPNPASNLNIPNAGHNPIPYPNLN